MKKLTLLGLVLLLAGPAWAQASAEATLTITATSATEHEAVRAAVLDYVEALYLVEPARIERSVHPSLAKVGYWRSEEDGAYQEARMTYDQLVTLAGRWNTSGQVDAETAPKVIEILDVMDKTATAKLTAEWGVDHMHLAKIDGRWMIMNVLWQSIPSE